MNKAWNTTLLFSILLKTRKLDLSQFPVTAVVAVRQLVTQLILASHHNHTIQHLKFPMESATPVSDRSQREQDILDARHQKHSTHEQMELDKAKQAEEELQHSWDSFLSAEITEHPEFFGKLRTLDVGYGLGGEQFRTICLTCTSLTSLAVRNTRRPFNIKGYLGRLKHLRTLCFSNSHFVHVRISLSRIVFTSLTAISFLGQQLKRSTTHVPRFWWDDWLNLLGY